MVRIGSYAAQNLSLTKNLETQARIAEKRIQISSGKQAQGYDGIARDTRRLEGLETRHAQTSAFSQAVTRTDQRLQEMESATGNIFDTASQFKALLLNAGNADNLDATNIVYQAQQSLESVAGDLNTQVDGRYLFAGSATDTKPVDLEAAGFAVGNTAYYQGNTDVMSVRAGEDLNLDYGITAEAQGFRDVIDALKRIADSGGVTNAQIDASLADVNSALDRVSDLQADLGSARDVLESTQQRLTDKRLATEQAIGEIENVDVAEAMTKLSGDQTTLESSYAITARLSRVSLLNFLR